MKTFKMIDCWVSAISIIFFAAASVFYDDGLLNDTLLLGYLVVGFWQAVSMCVHVFAGSFMQKWGKRYLYHWLSFIAIVTLPVGSYWILYVAAPFMAIYYTWLCYTETYYRMKRPMDLLK